MSNACILLAGGTSTRFGDQDKTLVPVDGIPAFIHSLKAFQDSGCVEQYIITYSSIDHKLALEKAIEERCSSVKSITLVEGGSRRQDSVYNGLKALESQDIEDVFIHDCARILVTKRINYLTQ